MAFPAPVVSFALFVRVCYSYVTKTGLLAISGTAGIFAQRIPAARTISEHVCGAADLRLDACRLVSSLGRERRKTDSRLWSRKLFDVKFSLAAKVNDLLARKKSPVGDHSGSGRAFHKLRIANCVRLRAANRFDEPQ